MKKNLLLLAVAVAALASCSNDETVATNQTLEDANTISFRTFVGGQTRAADNITGFAAGSSFKVTAFATGTNTTAYINDETFTGSGSPVAFNSTNKYYWPAGKLDFYAYAPSGNSQVTYTSWKQFDVEPAVTEETAGSQVDLVYASVANKGKTDGAGGRLPLNFRHTGSKVVLKVTHNNTSSSANLYFKVKAWAVGYLDKKGTFTFKDKTDNDYVSTATNNTGSADNTNVLPSGYWTNKTGWATDKQVYRSTALTSGNEKIIAGVPNTPTGAETTYTFDEEMILVPQGAITAVSAYDNKTTAGKPNGSYVAVQLAIYNKADNTLIQDYTWAMWPVSITWVPGKKYTYNVNLDDGGYFETNTDGGEEDDTNLDPILEGSIISFASVTVDSWNNLDATNATAVQ